MNHDPDYQADCKNYYTALRKIHSDIFTSVKRKISEKSEGRYHDGNVEGIENLYTFIRMLESLLLKKKPGRLKGVDYGCGSHFFLDDINTKYARNNWEIVGYDSDNQAIEKAKEKYPLHKDKFIHCDLLKEGIPQKDLSQDLVFCNAVIQHFDDAEVDKCFKDIARVLKRGGIFTCIFKRNFDTPQDWHDFSNRSGIAIDILDFKNGKIKIEDKTMKAAIGEQNKNPDTKIEKYGDGMRLFHVFSPGSVMQIAGKFGLEIIEHIQPPSGAPSKGLFTYYSGKGIPTAALFFMKKGY